MSAERKGGIAFMPDDAFGHWLAGLIDGEGSFGIYPSNKHRGHNDWRFCFGIKMRDDDAEMLHAIRDRLGIGRMYRERRKSCRWDSKPAIAWRIDAVAELRVLVGLLDRYPLRSRKAGAYDVWREALLTARGDWRRLALYRERLTQAQGYATAVAVMPPAADPPAQLFEVAA